MPSVETVKLSDDFVSGWLPWAKPSGLELHRKRTTLRRWHSWLGSTRCQELTLPCEYNEVLPEWQELICSLLEDLGRPISVHISEPQVLTTVSLQSRDHCPVSKYVSHLHLTLLPGLFPSAAYATLAGLSSRGTWTRGLPTTIHECPESLFPYNPYTSSLTTPFGWVIMDQHTDSQDKDKGGSKGKSGSESTRRSGNEECETGTETDTYTLHFRARRDNSRRDTIQLRRDPKYTDAQVATLVGFWRSTVHDNVSLWRTDSTLYVMSSLAPLATGVHT